VTDAIFCFWQGEFINADLFQGLVRTLGQHFQGLAIAISTQRWSANEEDGQLLEGQVSGS